MCRRIMRAWSLNGIGYLAGGCLCLLACALEPNYLDPRGPRFSGDYTEGQPATDGRVRVVSYNLAFGREVQAAIAALKTAPLAGADLILMQEMDASGVDRIASALRLRY